MKDDNTVATVFTLKHHLLTNKLYCVAFLFHNCVYFCTVFQAKIHDKYFFVHFFSLSLFSNSTCSSFREITQPNQLIPVAASAIPR